MLNFKAIEENIEALAHQFQNAVPFEHVVIDHFADETRLVRMIPALPVPGADRINKSRDYIFARNKFEKGNFKELSAEWEELYLDLTSARFQSILRTLSGQEVFVDPDFFGGGIHLGGKDSFLNMHMDFNYHPLHRN